MARFGKNALIYHDELVTAGIGQVGTQFDGPGHIGTHTSKGDFMYDGRAREEDIALQGGDSSANEAQPFGEEDGYAVPCRTQKPKPARNLEYRESRPQAARGRKGV